MDKEKMDRISELTRLSRERELTPDELKIALTAQQTSLTEGLRGLQADHLKLKQKTDRARSLAKQADLLNGQLADLEKQRFAATRRAANAKAGHAAASARVQQMRETMPKRDNPDALTQLQDALARLRRDRAAAMAARDAAVHRLHTAGVALDLIGVEHDDDAALAKALIVGENVDQRAARRGNILRGEPMELVPREDDVVAVDEQIFRVL